MNLLEKLTGSDITKQRNHFDRRSNRLPEEYRLAWKDLLKYMDTYSDFTGRNILPVLNHLLEFLEGAAATGKPIELVLDRDLKSFCDTLAFEQGFRTNRDRWRTQLNERVLKKLGGEK